MNFSNFWNVLKHSGKVKLETLTRKKEFTISYDSGHDVVLVIPSTTHPRSITRNEFEKVWSKARNVTNPYVPVNYHDITFQSSYVVAILKFFLKNEKIE